VTYFTGDEAFRPTTVDTFVADSNARALRSLLRMLSA